MRHFVIISGGTIDDFFADRWFEEEKPDAVIAADAGMEYLYRSHRVPDVIVGDFDSVGTEALAYFKTLPGVAIQKLIPEKDDTDTESAIRLAIRRGAERITLLGATGTRLDHVLGNIELLGIVRAFFLTVAADGGSGSTADLGNTQLQHFFAYLLALSGGDDHAGVGNGNADAGRDLLKNIIGQAVVKGIRVNVIGMLYARNTDGVRADAVNGFQVLRMHHQSGKLILVTLQTE